MVFIKRVFKKYKDIWSFAPSSVFLYKKMTKSIDFSSDIHIVEFWPWDWIFSDKLIEKLSPNSKISIFEIDETFCELLTKRYIDNSQVTVYNINAINICDFCQKDTIDYIVSSLPLAFIDKDVVCKILEKSKHILKPKWKFIQYQYFLQNKKDIKKVFWKIDYKFTLLNFPPAFVYVCHK